MTTDSLLESARADRLHYATGELLGADDFRLEQTYHRRQLARALLFLHGSGTIAGLRVAAHHQPALRPENDEVELEVEPGLALDGAGRLVEVPLAACLRLHRWFDFIATRKPNNDQEDDVADLNAAWRPNPGAVNEGAVVADVFLNFHACDRGYTPSFASGPFDALDASQPSRVRDAYQLSLVLRPHDQALPRATDRWTGVTAANLAERIFDAWTGATEPRDEVPLGVEPSAILLARLSLPARKAANAADPPLVDWSAAAWPNERANLDNLVRQFVVPPAALRRLAGF